MLGAGAGLLMCAICIAQGHDAPSEPPKKPGEKPEQKQVEPAKPAATPPTKDAGVKPATGDDSGTFKGKFTVQTLVVDRDYANAEELLTALETADAGMETLTADIWYDKTFGTAGDQQARKGKLYFQSLMPEYLAGTPGAKHDRRFAIHFDQLVIGTRRIDDPQIYIFDGTWLLEKRPNDKRYVRRQIVPAGQAFDPLRIGEGPLPIPIGQRKDDILSRYDAELLKASDGLTKQEDRTFVEGAYQIKLTPKAERRGDDKFAEIRLWYRADAASNGRLIPRMARTLTSAADQGADEGDESVVRLVGVKVNADIPRGAIDPAPPGEGWDGQTIEYRDPGAK